MKYLMKSKFFVENKKNIKKFEIYESYHNYKREQGFYLSLYNLENSKSEEDYVFYTEEDHDNFIINYVNEEIRENIEEIRLAPEDVGAIKDESGIPVFIDKEDAREWFNENSRESNRSSSCIMISDFCEIISNVKLDKEILELRDQVQATKKYNL